jgi:hypothetical protein
MMKIHGLALMVFVMVVSAALGRVRRRLSQCDDVDVFCKVQAGPEQVIHVSPPWIMYASDQVIYDVYILTCLLPFRQ